MFAFDLPSRVKKAKDDRYGFVTPEHVCQAGTCDDFLTQSSQHQLVLDPIKFKKKFHDIVGTLDSKVKTTLKIIPPKNGPNIMIQIKTFNRTYDVDLVPALKTTFPAHAKLPTWMTEDEKKELGDLGCFLVGKAWKGSKDKDASLAWRLSFSLQEKAIVKQLPMNLRGALMLAKKDLETVQDCWKSSQFRHLGVPSYFLKTILLKRMEKLPTRPNWQPVDMKFMYQRILKSLKSAVKYAALPHYFLPRANLAEGLQEEEKLKLCEWCEKTLDTLKHQKEYDPQASKLKKKERRAKKEAKPEGAKVHSDSD